MTEKVVYENTITYRQLLDKNGNLDRDLLDGSPDLEQVEEMYRTMVRARIMDEKSLKLQRQGRLGTYAPYKGQEAAQVGSIMALDDDDYMFPSYREGAAFLTRGVPIEQILLYWGGDERGNAGLSEYNAFPVSIPVGSQPIHAVGAMRAEQIKGNEDTVGLTYFGDGATSEGDMLEALNFAGVWGTPVIFLCQNNQWAISVPREKQTASETLAQKASGFGINGIQVDGNDPLAVHQAVEESRQQCIEQQEPVFIEAITFRRGDHTTADDASRYRSDEEIETWKELDPIKRTRRFLENQDAWSSEDERQLRDEAKEQVDNGVEAYEDTEPSDPEDIFQYTFETNTAQLEEQYQELVQELTNE